MKTKSFNKKLTLNKKTVVNLGNEEMIGIQGGLFPCTKISPTCERICLTEVSCIPHTCSCVATYNC
jgi:hypothetical protein